MYLCCIFQLQTLNCDVGRIKVKSGVCTAKRQYDTAGDIKRRTLVFYKIFIYISHFSSRNCFVGVLFIKKT